MTIGERIQILRKNNGLSQEELAQKILVSRQTVSQWETDQTVPSVDNIYRLKEVLNVSFDELMSDEKAEKEETEEKTEEEKPVEEYSFSYDETDVKSIHKLGYKKPLMQNVKSAVIIALAVIYFGYLKAPEEMLCFFIGILFLILAGLVKSVFVIIKDRKKLAEKITHRNYEYKIFYDRFEIKVFDENNFTSQYIVKRGDIDAVLRYENYLGFITRNQIFVLKKGNLKTDSRIYNFLYGTGSKKEVNVKSKTSVLSVILFVATLVCPWVAMFLVNNGSDHFDFVTSENMWKFFLLTPVPILSLIYGIYQNKKGIRNRKNIIIGLIILAFLCVFGSFTPIFENTDHNDYSIMMQWEEKLDVDFPDTGEISTQFEDEIPQSIDTHYYEESTVRFSDEDAEEFLMQISEDERWIEDVPDNLTGCFPDQYYMLAFRYHFLYNMTTGEINQVPAESGEYRFAYLSYDDVNGVLHIEDYTVELEIS